MKLRLVYPRIPEANAQQRALQKSWVEQSLRRSGRSQERRDETASLARVYAHPRERVENVVPLHPRDPQPPSAA